MSLILDALKKAERQHRLGEVPGIGSSPVTEMAIPHRGRTALIILALAIGLLLLGTYLGKPLPPPEPAPEPAVPSLPPLPTAQPSPVPEKAPAPQVQSQPEPVPSVALPPDNPQPLQQSEAQPASEALVDAAPVEAEPEPASVSVPDATPAPVSVPVPVPAPVQKAKAPTPAKQMSELPDGFVSNMPKLNIDIHSFDERPGRSYVLINMEKYHAGDYLAEGPLLAEILRDGVVLEYMGERFILPIGNY